MMRKRRRSTHPPAQMRAALVARRRRKRWVDRVDMHVSTVHDRATSRSPAEKKESSCSRWNEWRDKRVCFCASGGACKGAQGKLKRIREEVGILIMCSIESPHAQISLMSHRLQQAIDTARKGDDLWIDLSNSSLQLSKTKKVRS